MNTNRVLVVVDMQNGFLGEKARHVIPAVSNLVQKAEEFKIPVVFTRFHNRVGSSYETLIGWTRLRVSPEIDITSELQPHAERIIDKEIYSAFTPEFEQIRSQQGWSDIVICGVATDGCVLKTAVDAFERGLRPTVVTDACASHAGEDIHRAGLLLLGRFVGKNQLVNTDDLLRSWNGA